MLIVKLEPKSPVPAASSQEKFEKKLTIAFEIFDFYLKEYLPMLQSLQSCSCSCNVHLLKLNC